MNSPSFATKPPQDILRAILFGLYGANLHKNAIFSLCMSLLMALIDYINGINMFHLMDATVANDLTSVIKLLSLITGLWCLHTIIRCSVAVLNNRITENLAKQLNETYIGMYLNADKDWISERATAPDMTAIKSGISSCVSTYQYFNYIIESFLNAFASVNILFTMVGVNGIPIIFSMVIILGVGCKFLRDNYIAHKDISKATNPIVTCMTFISQSILPTLLNGNKNSLLVQLVENAQKKTHLENEVDNKVEMKYGCLELIHDILVGLNSIMISCYLEKLTMIVPIYNILNKACGSMWRLFHLFHQTAKVASGWSTLETITRTIILEVNVEKLPFNDPIDALNKCLKLDLSSGTRNVQICGESGVGKSTLLLNCVIMLEKLYGNVFNYMPQNVNVIKSEKISLYEFLTMDIPIELKDDNNKKVITKIILRLATELKLSEKVVCRDTLFEPLKKPSGGEEKRIALIQTVLNTFLQIELGLPIKRILICDEPTSGLDKANHDIVENMFNRLIEEHDIVKIEISHHENVGEIVKLDVIKEDVPKRQVWCDLDDEKTGLMWIIDMAIGMDPTDDDFEPMEVKEKPSVKAIVQVHDPSKVLVELQSIIKKQTQLEQMMLKNNELSIESKKELVGQLQKSLEIQKKLLELSELSQ